MATCGNRCGRRTGSVRCESPRQRGARGGRAAWSALAGLGAGGRGGFRWQARARGARGRPAGGVAAVTAVLGIDAAWTAGEPSGVALVEDDAKGRWRCLGVAPSYGQLVALAAGIPVDWAARPAGGLPNLPELLGAASALLGGRQVDVIAVDMPLATPGNTITGRRPADTAISKAFGGRGCSTHSPTAARPGSVATSLVAQGAAAGYSLATTPGLAPRSVPLPALIEVYPHTALLSLMCAPYRVPYKASRARRYWPNLSAAQCQVQLVGTWHRIVGALAQTIASVTSPIPSAGAATTMTMASLKRYDDALDAVVCAWVGIRYVADACTAYGDPTGAIWTP